MSRQPESSGVEAYYETLRKVFELQSGVLTGVLPHYGERGENNEERVRDFLSKVLPRKFAVGTGFVVCSNRNVAPSSQTDVVIYDEIHNSPLHRELAAYVYPAEMVYGTVEVKGALRPSDLRKVFEDIQKIRAFAEHRWYARYVSVPKDPARPQELVAIPEEFQITSPASRSFVFAFSQEGWKNVDSLVESLKSASKEIPAHVHGMVVLSENWYVAQEAYAPGEANYFRFTDNALLRFVNGLMHSLSSMPMCQCSIERYLAA